MSQYLKLIGIYHADGSFIGELRYIIGKITGNAHCPLCDITHGMVKEKKSFQQCKKDLAIPLVTVHLDERQVDILNLTQGKTPCVVGQKIDNSWEIVLNSEELSACNKQVGDFQKMLLAKVKQTC